MCCLWVLCLLSGQQLTSAQTLTPTPTPTKTPIQTFTPVPTLPSSGSTRFDCPDEVIYSDQVDLAYSFQCRHCLTDRPPTENPIGMGLGNVDLNVTPLAITPLSSRTPLPTIEVTYKPTGTPAFWVSATPVVFPTNTPNPLTPTPTIPVYITEVFPVQLEGTTQFHIVNGVTGAKQGGNPSERMDYDVLFYFMGSGNGKVFGYIPARNDVVGIQLWGTSGSAYLHNTAFYAGHNLVKNDLNQWVNIFGGFNGVVYNQFSEPVQYAEHFVNGWGTLTPTPEYVSQVYADWSNPALNPFYLQDIVLYRINPELDLVEPFTPTPTLTPTMTKTPNAFEVDCRFPYGHDPVPPLLDTDLGSVDIVAEECYTIFNNFYIDLTGFNPAWYWSMPNLEICALFIRVPTIHILGIPLPLEAVLVVVVVTFLFQRLSVF